MNPWNIIGWLAVLVVGAIIGLPILGWTLQRLGRTLMWIGQKELRGYPPTQYSRWVPRWSDRTYYINGVTDNSYMVSTDPNNRGGTYYSREEWDRIVQRRKMVKL